MTRQKPSSDRASCPPCSSASFDVDMHSHIKRYLALHAADANFKLVTTDRYRHFKVYDSDEEDEGNNSDASSALSSLSSRSDDPDSEDEPVDPNAPLDLGVIATKPFPVGEIIPRLLGSVADLTDEQDDALRGQRLDFSVTMNAGRNKFQALFGPARFVNVCLLHSDLAFR